MSDDMWRERRDRDDFSEYGSLFDDAEPTQNLDEVGKKKEPDAISFGASDTGNLPHWTDPPTGEVPRLDVDPDELPGRFLAGDDYVRFDVSVADGADASAWSSSVWLVEDGGGWRARDAGVDDAVPAVSFDLGHGTVEVTDSSGESTTYGE